MWEQFLFHYKGVTMLLPEEPLTQQALGIQVATDTDSWVVVMRNLWFKGTWGSKFTGKPVDLLKLKA